MGFPAAVGVQVTHEHTITEGCVCVQAVGVNLRTMNCAHGKDRS
jgi:hypothetical protein